MIAYGPFDQNTPEIPELSRVQTLHECNACNDSLRMRKESCVRIVVSGLKIRHDDCSIFISYNKPRRITRMSHQGADEQRLTETLSTIGRKYVVMSGKGGVGKSTVAVNLAVGLALAGRTVGLLDSDLHGPSVPKMLGLENFAAGGDETHLVPAELYNGKLKVMSVQFLLRNLHDSVIWRGPLKHAVISQFVGHTVWGALDFLIVDSPPGTGDEPLSVIQTAKPDGAIIVTTPQDVATHDVRKSIDFCEKLNLPVIGVIENMSGFACPHCGRETAIFSSGGGKRMALELGIPFMGTIPIDPRFVNQSDAGLAFVDGKNQGPALDAMNSIVTAIVNSHVTLEHEHHVL
jgi:ATP-binding protein involved in chromosome partitioning